MPGPEFGGAPVAMVGGAVVAPVPPAAIGWEKVAKVALALLGVAGGFVMVGFGFGTGNMPLAFGGLFALFASTGYFMRTMHNM